LIFIVFALDEEASISLVVRGFIIHHVLLSESLENKKYVLVYTRHKPMLGRYLLWQVRATSSR
jgi:hypothetical protein